MKRSIFIVLAVAVCFVFGKKHNYENFNIEDILSDINKTRNFIYCMRNDAKCLTQKDKDFKMDIKDMVATSCGDCTPKEKKNYEAAVKIIADRSADLEKALKNSEAST